MDLVLSCVKVFVTGGLKASAVGIVAAIIFGYLCSIAFKPHAKR